MTQSTFEEQLGKPYSDFSEQEKRGIRDWADQVSKDIIEFAKTPLGGFIVPFVNKSKAQLLAEQLMEALPKEMVE